MVDLFTRGLILGFLIAAPVGPIGVLCIRRTLNEGRPYGFLSGLGAATADSIYGLIAVFGLSATTTHLMNWQEIIRFIGGGFILFLGIKTFVSRPSAEIGKSSGKNLFYSYLTTFGLTLANPMTILSFAAAFAGLGFGTASKNFVQGLSMVGGVFVGSTIWWFFLSFVTGIIRERLTQKHLIWVNRISGFSIIVFSFVILTQPAVTDDVEITSSIVTQPLLKSEATGAAGFKLAKPGYVLLFPEDHGPHPDFQTEWWYYTGNVQDTYGRKFGYQLTIFRRGLLPPQQRHVRTSIWGTDQVYLGHFALTDVSEDRHHSFELLHRGAAGITGSQADPFMVWIKDWQVVEVGDGEFELHAGIEPGDGKTIQIYLNLASLKEPVLHGDKGYSLKGSQVGNASYYYSMTRLETKGEITIDDHIHRVHGYSWMDHEFSTSALSPGQVGWDWFSIQLEDGSELMVFQMRNNDGSLDPISSGTWISPDGEVVPLDRDDFSIEVHDYWKSQDSGGNYPSRWEIIIEGIGLSIELVPLVEDQEMELTYTYWEGAVQIRGSQDANSIQGYGYVELTGYAGTMAGEF